MSDRPVAANELARRRAESAAKRADAITPLTPAVTAAATGLPADDAPPAKAAIGISTQVIYRGRIFTLTPDPGMTLNEFCDLLDRRFGVAS